MRKPNMIVV
uniref:Uncharacterized protein n=1 Tax=Rhizophora mucronata TaxID=61149 RepID=A0A2P2QQV8_RHIMU